MNISHDQMRAAAVAIVLTVLVVFFGADSIQNHAVGAQPAGTTVPAGVDVASAPSTDQIIVKFAGAFKLEGMPQAEQADLLRQMSAAAGVELVFVRPMSGDAYVYRLPAPAAAAEIETISRRLQAMPQISLAEADRILQAVGRTESPVFAPGGINRTPNDPLFDNQWHYRYAPGSDEGINLPQAWDTTTGNSTTVVAVIDTGITNHVEFNNKVVPGYDFIFDSRVANDGDGRDPDPSDPGDWEPADFCGPGSGARNSSWHGTHVAGTIAAASDNGLGVAGVNWRAQILPVRVLGRCGGYSSDIVDGARWAAGLSVPGVPANSNPAAVINLSLGGTGSCLASVQAAVNDVVAAGTVVVVSAGNANQDAAIFSPGNCSKVITVAATDRSGDKAYYSNYGSSIELSAPGGEFGSDGVFSTVNSGKTVPENDSYAYFRGTSMAAPHVAGAASLLMGENPSLSPGQVLDRLQKTARQFPSGSSCNTSRCGAGIVDAGAALTEAIPATLTPTATATDEATPTPTNTSTPTNTPTATNTAAATDTPTATNTPPPGFLDAPTISDIANDDGDGSFSVQWTAVSGAEWYKVKQRRDDRNWKPVYEGAMTSLQRNGLVKAVYCYRVRAFNSIAYSDWSADSCTTVGIREPTPTMTMTATPMPSSTPTATPEGGVTPPQPPPDHVLFIPLARADR